MRRATTFAIGVLLVCAIEIPADADTITVSNTKDSGPGSLRQALADANDGDTINFAVTGTIALTSGELVIEKNITISGPGQNLLTVRPLSQTSFRVFNVLPSHSVTIQGLTISFGYAEFAQGGGIYLDEHVIATIADCFLTNNYTGDIGGAIFIDGFGGGAMLTVLNSIITGNTAGTTNHGGSGAGIESTADTLTIINSTVNNNTAWIGNDFVGGYGGGVDSGGQGTVEISNTTISGNQAGINGGGLSNSATATIINSTISGNTAGLFSPVGLIGNGGGISNFGTLTIINSTISGNNAYGSTFKGGGEGGGVYNGGSVGVDDSTLSGNQANVHGGSIYGGTFEIGNSILDAGAPENISHATVTSQGYNVCSDNGGGFLNGPGDQINTNPILGPLQNNGGPTLTHALLPGSPAVDAGDPNFTPPPDYDQRGPGFVRVFNGRLDAGSFEVQPTPTPAPTATATPIVTATPTPTACTVTSPICGTIVVNPTDFVIEVSDPLDPVTVQASDLTINGIPAIAFSITNGNTTITFHFKTSPVVAGSNSMHVPAGAFDCGPPTDFDCTFESFGIHPTPSRGGIPTPRPRPTPAPRP